MAEVDNLRAMLFDCEDELACLQADLRHAGDRRDWDDVDFIESAIDNLLIEMADIRDEISQLERAENAR